MFKKLVCSMIGCKIGDMYYGPFTGWYRYRCDRCGCWTLCFRDLQIKTNVKRSEAEIEADGYEKIYPYWE